MPEKNEQVEALKAQLKAEKQKALDSLDKANAAEVAKKDAEESIDKIQIDHKAQLKSAQKDAEESLKLAESSEDRAVKAEKFNADLEEELTLHKGKKSTKKLLHDRKIRNGWKHVDYSKPWFEFGLEIKDSVTGAMKPAHGEMTMRGKSFAGKAIHFDKGLSVTNHHKLMRQLAKVHHNSYMIEYDPYCLKHKVSMEFMEGTGKQSGFWECPECENEKEEE